MERTAERRELLSHGLEERGALDAGVGQDVHRRRLPLRLARAQKAEERRQDARAHRRELSAAARLGELLQQFASLWAALTVWESV